MTSLIKTLTCISKSVRFYIKIMSSMNVPHDGGCFHLWGMFPSLMEGFVLLGITWGDILSVVNFFG
jgi:hypothetical protein